MFHLFLPLYIRYKFFISFFKTTLFTITSNYCQGDTVRLLFISFILLFISGCMETPELSPSKEIISQDQIKSNQTAAEKAKEEYIKLKKQRSSE